VSPGPNNTGAPRLGDVANLVRSVDRMDGIEARLVRVESKLDKVLEALLTLKPNSIAKRR
jgi:hypothetical protein